MATNVVKSNISEAISDWLDESLRSGQPHKLSVNSTSGYVTLRANESAWSIEVEDAANLVATKLYDLYEAKDNRLQGKSYSANKYYLKSAGVSPSAFGPDEKAIQPREYTARTSGRAEGAVSTGKGKTEVERIDADLARLEARLLKLDTERAEVQGNIFHLTAIRPGAVKRDEEAKAAKEAQKKADEEAQAQALQEVMSMSDDDLEAEIAAQKAKLDLMRKAIAAKRQAVTVAA